MNINLTIERLILDGLHIGAGHGVVVKSAVEAELSRLLAHGGVAPGLQSGGAFPSVRARSIQVSAEEKPTQLGRQIARAVYGGIGEGT